MTIFSETEAAQAVRQAAEQAQAEAHEVMASLSANDITADMMNMAADAAATSPFVFQLSIFVLAVFVGYYVVWNVTPALHTPLMAVTNAISSVIIVGALLAVGVQADIFSGSGPASTAKLFGLLALIMASVNIFGGFLVTQRMLAMYRKKG